MATATPSFSSPFTDLSAKLPEAYQLLEVASRTIIMARSTGGFYKTPKVLAAVNAIQEDLDRIVSGYHRGESNTEPEVPASGLLEEGDLEGAPAPLEADDTVVE